MTLWEIVGPLLRAHLPAALVALAVGYLVNRADPSGVPAIAASAFAIIASYLAVFAVTGLDRDERRALLRRVRSRPTGPVEVASPGPPDMIAEPDQQLLDAGRDPGPGEGAGPGGARAP
jgi:hypothetical protein